MLISTIVIDNIASLSRPFIISALSVNLIFLFKFVFIEFSTAMADQNPAMWVNAQLIAFAAKFILVLGILFALSRVYGTTSKALILWTAILYCILLIPDFIFAHRNRREPKN
jgi:hypothetical protein